MFPVGNHITVVVEQPFGKHFGERTFDFAREADQSVASPSPANSAGVGRRIHRSTACHNVNEIG